MSIPDCIVEVPLAAVDGRWWPNLFLRKGRKLLQVTPEQASHLMGIARGDSIDPDGNITYPRPSSEVPNIVLHDIDGRKVGHVSYNGRVWLHDIDGNKEIPLPGEKTAAQHEAEGWKDYRV